MKVRTISDFVPASLVGTAAGKAIARATAHIRHSDRVAATVEAAQKWAEENESVQEYALLADVCGGGNGTSRHNAFRALGKGRKQATDGAAYQAAAMQALFQGRTMRVAGVWGEVAIWLVTPEEDERCFRFGKPEPAPNNVSPDWFPSVGLDGYTLGQTCPERALDVADELIRHACKDPREKGFFAGISVSVEDAGRFYNEVALALHKEEQDAEWPRASALPARNGRWRRLHEQPRKLKELSIDERAQLGKMCADALGKEIETGK
jgi:hypothetical protein